MAEIALQQSAEMSPVNAGSTPKVPSSRGDTPKALDSSELAKGIMDRIVPPLESTTVTVQIFGVFSLPEGWKTKVREDDRSRFRRRTRTATRFG